MAVAGGIDDFDEAHATLHHPARHDALCGVAFPLSGFAAVESEDMCRFTGEIERLRGGILQALPAFEAGRASGKERFIRVPLEIRVVQLAQEMSLSEIAWRLQP